VSQSQFQSNCSAESLQIAASKVIAGNLVAFPTETVYGLGADACNADAIARIYAVKGRPADHPLIVHISAMDRMGDWAKEIPTYAIALARDFWPGPMTLILPRTELAQDFITGGQESVGIRVPDHVVARGLLQAFEKLGGKGIAAPSANRFGQVSPTTAKAVDQEIGEYLDPRDLILDGGACEVGVESTIIDCTGDAPRILRPGAITEQMIRISTDISELKNSGNDIRVSGSLENHYAPSAKIFLDVTAQAGQGLIALADIPTPPGVIRLSAPATAQEFAHLLYESLRKADTDAVAEVVVIQPKGDGIAVAIRDRLARAANGR